MEQHTPPTSHHRTFRAWFARTTGMREEHKQEVYIELSQSAALHDGTYWLQLFFACGIATLGLILDSPAVIIGAMLISPLMGPILSCGLSLAAGDPILGIRSSSKLLASCLIAITFSFALTAILPFKEMTDEIAARIRPNTLDLVIALFSGAIGTIATGREARGAMTSIPGVAIAVALMPPLCVVGYGLGVATGIDTTTGMEIAGGGALLFLTNLVAITFSAMLVFLAFHMDTEPVKRAVRAWRQSNRHDLKLQRFLEHTPIPRGLMRIGSPAGRMLPVFAFVLILMPLTRSFNHLSDEISRQQQENTMRRVATGVWREAFEHFPDGRQRSYIDQVTTTVQGGMARLHLRVFTGKPYSADERSRFAAMTSARLGRPADSLRVEIVEVPTTSGDLPTSAAPEAGPPEITEAVGAHIAIASALRDLRFPPAMALLGYELIPDSSGRMRATIHYLADRDISDDAAALIADDLRSRMDAPELTTGFERIPASTASIDFERGGARLSGGDSAELATIASVATRYPGLRLVVEAGADTTSEPATLATRRADTIRVMLTTAGGLPPARITATGIPAITRSATVTLSAGR